MMFLSFKIQCCYVFCLVFFFFVSLLCDSAFFRIDACFVQEQERCDYL
jgi:hypothetical protein